jgi:hypothetical protein
MSAPDSCTQPRDLAVDAGVARHRGEEEARSNYSSAVVAIASPTSLGHTNRKGASSPWQDLAPLPSTDSGHNLDLDR